MAKLPDDFTKFSHEALEVLSTCGNTSIEVQAKREILRRYENRPVGSEDNEFIVFAKAEIFVRVRVDEIDNAKILAQTELDNKKNSTGYIELISADPRILDISIVLNDEISVVIDKT